MTVAPKQSSNATAWIASPAYDTATLPEAVSVGSWSTRYANRPVLALVCLCSMWLTEVEFDAGSRMITSSTG